MSEKPRKDDRYGAETAAHDVLATEEFAMPAADPTIHHPPVVLPEDPTGIIEPHDILAAEEFAMPAVRPHAELPQRRGAVPSAPRLIAVALLALLLLRRRRRRRQSLQPA